MTTKADDRSTEYQSLRQELRESTNRDFNLINLGITATGVILGIAITQETSLVFLVALVPLSLVLFQLSRNALSFLRIAFYIRTFIEPYSGFEWETKLNDLRKQFQCYQRSSKHTLFGTTSYEIAAILLGIVTIILAALYIRYRYDYVACGVAAILWWIFSTIIHARLAYVRSGQYEDDLEILWQERS